MITIKDLLKGTKPTVIQRVGAMHMIVLESEKENTFTGYVPFQGNGTVSNSSYGQLRFNNKSDAKMIIPANAAFLSKTFGQDHAIMGSHLVDKKSYYEDKTAACVQQTRGGYIPEAEHEMTFLPYGLREVAYNKRTISSYNKLWEEIKEFNRKVGANSSSGHLEYYYDHFQKELDEFVAEFESLPKQVGAIILINGNVAGIERVPNYEYWQKMWKPLIRGVYGGLMLEYIKTGKVDIKEADKITGHLNLKSIKNLNDLENQVNKTNTEHEEKIKEIVRSLITDQFNITDEQIVGTSTKKFVENNQFQGHVIAEGPLFPYTSLVTKTNWFKDGIKYAKFADMPNFDI